MMELVLEPMFIERGSGLFLPTGDHMQVNAG
jgi:hypothetical protein